MIRTVYLAAILILLLPIKSTPSEKMVEYVSKLGFAIKYPSDWKLYSTIEEFANIKAAEDVGGNHFSIYNYDIYKATPTHQNITKIEVWLFENIKQPNAFHKKSFDLLNSQLEGSKKRTLLIDGKKAFKINKNLKDNGGCGFQKLLTIYYRTGKRGVIFNCYYDTELPEVDSIVKTFKFLR